MASIEPTNTPGLFEAAVQAAADALRAGHVVALPTETVYGLAANALDAGAVEKIFAVKGRPATNPIIVHVAGVEMARSCVRQWTPKAERLAAAFWPGPLTLVLPKAPAIPDIVTASGDTVGIRWPRHPVTESIIRRCGFPLAAPSANLSGQVSPTTAAHVERSLVGRIDLIIDGGPCEVGIESTVLDLSEQPPRVLRPGIIHEESLAALIGSLSSASAPQSGVLRSPGLLLKHYSPTAKLLVWQGTVQELRTELDRLRVPLERVHLLVRGQVPPGLPAMHISLMPGNPKAFAKALYAEWHRADEAGAELIVMEALPADPDWEGVRDRLRRAAV
jgi:L-threonylcarbamoyladenylate synthase